MMGSAMSCTAVIPILNGAHCRSQATLAGVTRDYEILSVVTGAPGPTGGDMR